MSGFIRFSEVQLELPTVIAHEPLGVPATDSHKPAGVRLAKMLGQYEANPSSELWSSIQSLAREILN